MDQDREDTIRRLIRNYYNLFHPNTAIEPEWLLPAVLGVGTKFYELRYDYRGEKVIVRHRTAELSGKIQVLEEYKYGLSRGRKVRRTKYTIKEFICKRAINAVGHYDGSKPGYSKFYLKIAGDFKDDHKVPDEVWTKLL